MKKTVTLPDGTVEVLEGTPEEIAAHEKLIREKVVKEQRKKPDVLKGSEPEDLAKKLQEIFDKLPKTFPQYPRYPIEPWWPTERPIWIAPACSVCSSTPCACPPLDWYKIFCGTTPALTCSAPDHWHERVYDGSSANARQTGWVCMEQHRS